MNSSNPSDIRIRVESALLKIEEEKPDESRADARRRTALLIDPVEANCPRFIMRLDGVLHRENLTCKWNLLLIPRLGIVVSLVSFYEPLIPCHNLVLSFALLSTEYINPEWGC